MSLENYHPLVYKFYPELKAFKVSFIKVSSFDKYKLHLTSVATITTDSYQFLDQDILQEFNTYIHCDPFSYEHLPSPPKFVKIQRWIQQFFGIICIIEFL